MTKARRSRGPRERACRSQPRDRGLGLSWKRWPLWAAACAAVAAVIVAAVLVRPSARRGSPDPAEGGDRRSPGYPAIEALIRETTAAVQRLVEQDPNDPAPWCLAGQMHRQFGDTDAAVAAWEKCLTLDDGFVDAYVGIGSVRLERDEHETAETALRKALALKPDSPQATVLLATALANQGKLREIVALLEGRVEDPRAGMPCFLLLGQAYLQLREYAKAKPCFEAAVRLAPEFANAHYGLATTCTRLGLEQEAQEHLKRFKAAESVRLSKHIDGAKRPDDDAARVRQSAADVYAAAAAVYASRGDAAEAERHRGEAEKLRPAYSDARRGSPDPAEVVDRRSPESRKPSVVPGAGSGDPRTAR